MHHVLYRLGNKYLQKYAVLLRHYSGCIFITCNEHIIMAISEKMNLEKLMKEAKIVIKIIIIIIMKEGN